MATIQITPNPNRDDNKALFLHDVLGANKDLFKRMLNFSAWPNSFRKEDIISVVDSVQQASGESVSAAYLVEKAFYRDDRLFRLYTRNGDALTEKFNDSHRPAVYGIEGTPGERFIAPSTELEVMADTTAFTNFLEPHDRKFLKELASKYGSENIYVSGEPVTNVLTHAKRIPYAQMKVNVDIYKHRSLAKELEAVAPSLWNEFMLGHSLTDVEVNFKTSELADQIGSSSNLYSG